jgi:hypothetical protein
MESSKQLATRFRDVILTGKWIANTNFKDQLTQVTWQQATQKVSSLNTLAALAYHINYYVAGVLNVFEGGELEIRDKYSFDLPEIQSQADWEKLLNDFWSNAEKFADHIESISEEKLEKVFVKEAYGTYRRNIEGMIEHCYYHLGQVSLIRKMIMES